MKRLTICGLLVLLMVAFGSMLRAQQGPNIAAFPDATATQCAAATPVAANQTTIVAASNAPGGGVASQMCIDVQNSGTTNPARCGDNVSAQQGVILNPVPASQPTGSVGTVRTICVTNALKCCGVGGSTIIGGDTTTR